MRFGLSDLDELPSLKEFEQLAQAALGSDAGIAPTEPEGEVEGQSESAATSEADAPKEVNVAPGLRAPSVEADASEQPAETESTGSPSPAESADDDEADSARAKGTSA
jgi:hypothetical protein